MDTSKLRRFSQYVRRTLVAQTALKVAQVLSADSAARRESPQAVAALIKQIELTDIAQVIDKVAYTWFNRFCALRFMDVNGYSRSRVVSPADESQFQPEILADAKMGHIDAERVPEKTRLQVAALLSGSATSRDPQQEAYRLLIVAECNSFHKAMPYLFERIADYTELLMPDDLLSGNSILSYTREAMTPDACQDVEVIGWLYQFYISEKKDQVFEGLKKGRKISAADIPAATQLFTPHWIVRYLVENSLGRLWMLNHPNSGLIGQMDYYIKPEQAETDFLRIQRPEDIKVCDPACGSGHMLTYAFDLLYAIYEEVGIDTSEIPTKILTHNLYGIELDERAGDLAAFALTMKARARQRRFFDKAVAPNICVLEKVEFDSTELDEYMAAVGRDLFTMDLRETLQQFDEADNFGSLIRPKMSAVNDVLPLLAAKDLGGQLFLTATHDKVLKALHQADYLSQKYQVVVANPPYMGPSAMNLRLKEFAETLYPDAKADAFAMFISRSTDLCIQYGAVGMVTMHAWMFTGTFEALRRRICSYFHISNLAHMGPRAFDSISGEVVQTVAFVLDKAPPDGRSGCYVDLTAGRSESDKCKNLSLVAAGKSGILFRRNNKSFGLIPGAPIAYWLPAAAINAFTDGVPLASFCTPKKGMVSSDNARFLRRWHEVSFERIAFGCSGATRMLETGAKWAPYNKGGTYRKWYGNNSFIINWDDGGKDVIEFAAKLYGSASRQIQNVDSYFKPSVTWSEVGSGPVAGRQQPQGFIFDSTGPSIFGETQSREIALSLLCTNVVGVFARALNPTLHLTVRNVAALPIPRSVLSADTEIARLLVSECVEIARADWDSFEMSWDFIGSPLICSATACSTVAARWKFWVDKSVSATQKILELETKNNNSWIHAYSLQELSSPDALLINITLGCNSHHRFPDAIDDRARENRWKEESVKEFISYAVGCMFGRYSLDKPGLILANAGDTLAEYLQQVPKPSFTPDADNVIPMLDGDWFTDDATERCRSFLRVTFGEEKYEENLRFIEDALVRSCCGICRALAAWGST